MKGYQVFVVITILIVTSLLSGCNNATPLNTAPPAHIPTKTPVPTKPGPTPVPQVVWADRLKQVAALNSPGGEWSPTANTYLYRLKFDYSTNNGGVQLMSAPLFEPYTITNYFSYDDSFFWAPDGQTIFFHTFLPDSFHIDGRHLWATDEDGKNPRIVDPHWFGTQWVNVIGWLDSQTIVVSHYFGGRTYISTYNISTAKRFNGAGVHGSVFPPQHGYIPVTSDSANADPRLMVIAERFPNVDYMRASGSLRLLPSYNNVSIDYSISKFEGWLGDTNKILLFWGHMKETYGKGPLETNLLLWDVDKNSLRLLAPGGVGGQFSPDGKYMAYMTFGPVQLNQTPKLTQTPESEDKTEPLYLQLLDMSSNKAILSLPSFSWSEYEDFIFKKHQFLQAKFSADSRYLAFVTPGKIETDTNQWPLRVADDPSHVYLNVLDLQTKQLIWAALSNKGAELSWSPDNAHLLFQNQDKNWFLYSTRNQNVIPVTKDHGSSAIQPAWSYDGHYFRFITCPRLDGGTSCTLTDTVIFDTTH